MSRLLFKHNLKSFNPLVASSNLARPTSYTEASREIYGLFIWLNGMRYSLLAAIGNLAGVNWVGIEGAGKPSVSRGLCLIEVSCYMTLERLVCGIDQQRRL